MVFGNSFASVETEFNTTMSLVHSRENATLKIYTNGDFVRNDEDAII